MVLYHLQLYRVEHSGETSLVIESICMLRHSPSDYHSDKCAIEYQHAGIELPNVEILFVSGQPSLLNHFSRVNVSFDEVHGYSLRLIRSFTFLNYHVEDVLVVSCGCC